VAALNRDLQAARYRAQRAERQYESSDPENRLVTQELERRWDNALKEVQSIQSRLAAETEDNRAAVHVGSVEEFKDLAGDLEAVWSDPRSDERTKKRLLRTLIREVLVDIDEQTSELIVLIHWKGGVHTPLRLKRRKPGERSTQTPKNIVEAVRMLSRIQNDEKIAGVLNRARLQTAHGNYWTRALVTSLRFNHGIECHDPKRQAAEGWLNLSQAARLADVTNRTLRLAIERGEIAAERPIQLGPWIVKKEELQSEAAKRFLARVLSKSDPTVPISNQTLLDLSIT
jgi:hypothetical protein